MISIEAQLRCARRELQQRRVVYPSRVESKKMPPEQAAHELAAMEAIIRSLEALRDAARARKIEIDELTADESSRFVRMPEMTDEVVPDPRTV